MRFDQYTGRVVIESEGMRGYEKGSDIDSNIRGSGWL
jgi:hypothetical protein